MIKGLLLSSVLLLTAISSFAKPNPYVGDGDSYRIYNLEQRVSSLEARLYQLERMIGSNPAPAPISRIYSCLLVDTGYSKTYLGEGRNNLEAEAEARASCGKGVNSVYCTGKVKCTDYSSTPGNVAGYVCMITDSGYGKSFRGDGANIVQAEAKAKMDCQNSVNAVYCGNVEARCESY